MITGNKDEQTTAMGQAMAGARETAQPQAQQPQSRANQPAMSLLNLGRLVDQPLSRTPAAENLTKMVKAMQKIVDDGSVNPDLEISLIPLDKDSAEAQLQLSVLIVATRYRAQPKLGVGFQILLLEGSVDPIQPIQVNANGIQIEVIKTPADADTAALRTAATNAVARAAGVSINQVFLAMPCAVPRGFNVEDEALVRELLRASSFAASFSLQRHLPSFHDLDLSKTDKDAALVINTVFHQPNILDSVGQPVRSDIVTRLIAEGAKDPASDQPPPTRELAVIRAFVDAVWTARPQQYAYAPIQQGVNPMETYIPRIVITALEATIAPTMACQQLALWVSMAIVGGNAWMPAFEQPYGASRGAYVKDVDLKDIGATGYEVNYTPHEPNWTPAMINTKSSSFGRPQLAQMLMSSFKQTVVVSLDVAEAGPDTSYNGVFLAAADGSPAAIQAVKAGADTLTGNNFSANFPTNGAIFENDGVLNRIHLGYVVDGKGEKHDIREIDTLAVLNFFGGRNPEIVAQFTNTYSDLRVPVDVRLYTRLKIIRMMFAEVVITGFARRLTFTQQYLGALANGAIATQHSVTNRSPMFDTSTDQRVGGQFSSSMLDANVNAGFSRAGLGGATPQVGRSQFGNRWQA